MDDSKHVQSMYGWMNERIKVVRRTDGRIKRCIYGWMDESKDVRTDGWTNQRMYGQMDGRIKGCTDGWMDELNRR